MGGVARKTREAIILHVKLVVLILLLLKQWGVGQSETAVHSMVDFFLLLKLLELVTNYKVKRGIMEMADAIVINKQMETMLKAHLAKVEFNRALHLFPSKSSGWNPKVTTCSAITTEGISGIWDIITAYTYLTKQNGFFQHKRRTKSILDDRNYQ